MRSNFTGRLLYSRLVRIGFGGGLMTWKTSIGRLKVENKFDLKKMTRNKKLELD